MATMMDISAQARKAGEQLVAFGKSNRQPAIEEPVDDFEKSVNDYDDVKALQQKLADLKKVVDTEERRQRDGLADSLRDFFAAGLKEGVNDYTLSNGRKLKLTHGVDRKIDNSQLAVARAAFEQVGTDGEEDLPCTFDALLRPKYEIVAAEKKKLGVLAWAAFSRCITSKFKAATLVVD